ncbi:MAG: hypothetical protein A2X86_11185 [Bdellovibrionales bacterium GWA2_49_15]|nr:MAG: hypothetical protein A2X86_11185 [Bdellovibrionales bacterium GWA2_49_15]HAZ12686.1 hypothetical protein [Bdellovibrionales bacterium]
MLTTMQKKVLSYPCLADRIKDNVNDKTKVLKNVKEIAATFSKPTIDSFGRVLDSIVSHLYDNINFDLPPGLDLKKLLKENHVVLVPNHQSHADYLALNYIIYKHYKVPVFIAGGINLDIFPIGTIFRKSGCFFIRRSFSSDILYKLTLEAYLFYLLGEGHPIEFFFEGGRSRTGKLLPPRFGLFHMLLEAHSHLPELVKKPLLFLPVTIAHEYVPEQKSLAREMSGGKKKKESTGQLLKLYKVFAYHMGSMHIKVGTPIQGQITGEPGEDLKQKTQALAFDCFRAVGKKMLITPSSLMGLIMLDGPVGALKFEEIRERALKISEHCHKFNLPISNSLAPEKLNVTIERAVQMFIKNNKIEVIGTESKGHVFYSVKKDTRMELLYFKNMILHHFLVPWIINSAWLGLFTGRITTKADLGKHFLRLRAQLKYEFYLPTIKELFLDALAIISASIGREVKDLEDCLQLSHKDLYLLVKDIGVFSRCVNYLLEGYYIGALAVKAMYVQEKQGIKTEAYLKKCRDVFETEMALGRVIKFSESFSHPVARNALKYLENQKILTQASGPYIVTDLAKLDQLLLDLELQLTQHMKFQVPL